MTSLAVDASVRKTNVHTKEDADHSLPYLLAVALFDGDVQTAQLNPERIAKPDVQSLLLKVSVKPDESFTARFPAEFPSRITVRLKNGQSFSHEVSNYPGFPTRPFSWEEISAKFDKLAAGHVGGQLGRGHQERRAVARKYPGQRSDKVACRSELKIEDRASATAIEVRFWPEASFGCVATIRPELGVKPTCQDGLTDALVTQTGPRQVDFAVMHCAFRRWNVLVRKAGRKRWDVSSSIVVNSRAK